MIIATDLDGTLTGAGEHITPGNIRALAIAKAYGVTCVLATGRPSRCLDPYRDRLDLFDAVITCNGAELITPSGPRVVAPLDQAHIDATAAVLHKHAIAGFFAFEFGSWVGHEPGYHGWPATDTGMAAVVAPFEFLRDRGGCAKLLFLPDHAGCDSVVALLKHGVGESIAATHANPTDRHGPIEIGSAAATKGNALVGWLKDAGNEGEELIAFGDQLNDLSMLQVADMAFAVGPGHPSLGALFPSLSNDDGTAVGRWLLRELLPLRGKEAHAQQAKLCRLGNRDQL